MAPPRVPLSDRWWAKVDVRGPDECWPWRGAYGGKSGRYGLLRLPGREGGTTTAHRVGWTLLNGPIPEGLHVLHRCDNPPCCNPRHWFLGTNQDNVDDKVAKGRQPVRAASGHRGVYRDADGRIYAEIARKGHRRRKHGFATVTEAAEWRARELEHIGTERVGTGY